MIPNINSPFPHKYYNVTVTPELAAEWLETSIGNRFLSEGNVDYYVRPFASGEYVGNMDQGIAFTCHEGRGRLFQGHHRLTAVVRYGRPVVMCVEVGLPLAAVGIADQAKPRGAADAWAMRERMEGRSGELYTYKMAAARVVLALSTADGDMDRLKTLIARRPTQQEQHSIVNSNRDLFDWACRTGSGFPAAVYGTIAYAHPLDPHRISSFLEQLKGKEDVKAGCGALLLRNYITASNRRTAGADAQNSRIKKTLNAIRLHLEDRTVSRLFEREDTGAWFAKRLAKLSA
jgi:hypothetical protein